MNSSHVKTVSFMFISLIIGIIIGSSINFTTNSNLYEILSKLPPGSKVEVITEEGTTPSSETYTGESIFVKSKKALGRYVSWFGLGATEVAAKDQGIQTSESGGIATVGKVKGFGLLESMWVKIRSWLWTVAIILFVLLVLTFIPQTSAIATGILRAIASVFPVIGSFVENLVAKFHWKKPFVETVKGGQIFKTLIKNDSAFSSEQKEKILQYFKMAMQSAQDEFSQNKVKKVKTEL